MKSEQKTFDASEIARLISGDLIGDAQRTLRGVNSLDLAGPDDLSFVSSPKHFKDGEASRAACLIAPKGFRCSTKTVIIAAHPKASFVKAVWLFHPQQYTAAGIHSSVTVDPSASIAKDVTIGPQGTIGKDVKIGARTSLAPGVVVGDGVTIGADCQISPNVTLYHDVQIGSKVILHAGTVVGADGFGFVLVDGALLKVPQLGTVIIEDNVEIGANCTIDRATFGSTIVKRGTKLDNLVHIAHNVSLGEHSALAAGIGIAGSSKIGNYATMGGHVGISDNAKLGDYVTLGARTLVITGQKIPSHQTVWGVPARPMEEVKRAIATTAQLPKLLERIRKLEATLNALQETVNSSKVTTECQTSSPS